MPLRFRSVRLRGISGSIEAPDSAAYRYTGGWPANHCHGLSGAGVRQALAGAVAGGHIGHFPLRISLWYSPVPGQLSIQLPPKPLWRSREIRPALNNSEGLNQTIAGQIRLGLATGRALAPNLPCSPADACLSKLFALPANHHF